MNFLEELELPVLSPQQNDAVATEMAPLLPQLEAINRDAQSIAKVARDSAPQKQLAIIDELYRWNKEKLEMNNKMLHDNISKEAEISKAMEKMNSGYVFHGDPSQLRTLQQKLKGTHEKIVSILEEVDLVAIGNLKGLKKNQALPSFNKLWMWVLETFYGYPASKYYWPEFKSKAFNKDKGAELRRRMIIHKYGELSDTEKLELAELNDVHNKVIRDYINSVELKHFLEVVELIYVYVDLYEKYDYLKKKGTEDLDVNAVRQEEEKVLQASAKFNGVKYDVITEMQNILFMVHHEFKPQRDD